MNNLSPLLAAIIAIIFVMIMSACSHSSGRGCYNYDEWNKRYVSCGKFHNGQ